MEHMMKPAVGTKLPEMSFPQLGGGTASIGGPRDRYMMLVIYRGKHCPKCKTYLNQLEEMSSEFAEAGVEILVTSADPEAKAATDKAEFGWTFPLCYDLSETQMRSLGTYVSDPLSPDETDRRFSEPAVFCVKPDGELQIACISNGPSARPDLVSLLGGIKFNIANDRPTRGLA